MVNAYQPYSKKKWGWLVICFHWSASPEYLSFPSQVDHSCETHHLLQQCSHQLLSSWAFGLGANVTPVCGCVSVPPRSGSSRSHVLRQRHGAGALWRAGQGPEVQPRVAGERAAQPHAQRPLQLLPNPHAADPQLREEGQEGAFLSQRRSLLQRDCVRHLPRPVPIFWGPAGWFDPNSVG